jgi:hypothetical protein
MLEHYEDCIPYKVRIAKEQLKEVCKNHRMTEEEFSQILSTTCRTFQKHEILDDGFPQHLQATLVEYLGSLSPVTV